MTKTNIHFAAHKPEHYTCLVCGKNGANVHTIMVLDGDDEYWYNGVSWHKSCFNADKAIGEARKELNIK